MRMAGGEDGREPGPSLGTGADVRPLAGGWESSDLHPAGQLPPVTAGAARTLHRHPDPAGSHQQGSVPPQQLQPQPLHYPPSACRWQETAENEDFTALANSQESLDGRKML